MELEFYQWIYVWIGSGLLSTFFMFVFQYVDEKQIKLSGVDLAVIAFLFAIGPASLLIPTLSFIVLLFFRLNDKPIVFYKKDN